VQDRAALNLAAARGVAVREFPLLTGYADYLLFVDRRSIGAVEAQSEKYGSGQRKVFSDYSGLCCGGRLRAGLFSKIQCRVETFPSRLRASGWAPTGA
jgi:hypothetical protein